MSPLTSCSAQCADQIGLPSMAEHLLDAARAESPVIRETISAFGASTLSAYLQQSLQGVGDALQGRADFLDVVYQYVEPLLGEGVAHNVCSELDVSPVILTTNHHGVDFFAQSVQGSLIFSLRSLNGNPAKTVPIFACGGVPLDNLTYPQGLLLYQVDDSNLAAMPRKLPIFPNRLRRQIVSAAAPINQPMVQRALQRAAKMVSDNEISSSLFVVLQQILEDYGAQPIIDLPTYSDQAVVLNHRIWKRLFADSESVPDMVYLELEKIAAALLEVDLMKTDSLASRVLLDSVCREQVLGELDGLAVCWERDKLANRLAGQFDGSCGTIFFWGISDANRRVPLALVTGTSGDMLRGIDDRGQPFEHPFDPESIAQGLRAKQLLPSLFTCFLTLAFARGVACLGGYYQAQYLPAIQRGLGKALNQRGDYDHVADDLEQVHTAGYCGGMQAVMHSLDHDHVVPAGPIEIIASGGLTSGELERVRALSVYDAHIASLFETIPDLGLSSVDPADWRTQLALDFGRKLGGRVVVN